MITIGEGHCQLRHEDTKTAGEKARLTTKTLLENDTWMNRTNRMGEKLRQWDSEFS
jgi:hypothetical protein